MCKLVFFPAIVIFSSCASPKYSYYFDLHESDRNNIATFSGENIMSPIASNDISTAGLHFENYEQLKPVMDTTIVAKDSLFQEKQYTNSDSGKEETRKMASEKTKKEQLKSGEERHASIKNKKLNGFAIAGPILLVLGFLSGAFPVAAIVLAGLGLIATIIGLKSKLWGVSLGTLIALAVALTLLAFLILMEGIFTGGDAL